MPRTLKEEDECRTSCGKHPGPGSRLIPGDNRGGQRLPAVTHPGAAVGRLLRRALRAEPLGQAGVHVDRSPSQALRGRSRPGRCVRLDDRATDGALPGRERPARDGRGRQGAGRGRPQAQRYRAARRRLVHRLRHAGRGSPPGGQTGIRGVPAAAVHRSYGLLRGGSRARRGGGLRDGQAAAGRAGVRGASQPAYPAADGRPGARPAAWPWWTSRPARSRKPLR